MNFQVDKKLNYDHKHIISQRKTTSTLGTYEHVEDEVLALIANHSYIEHDVDMSNNDQEEDKGSEAQAMVDPIIGTLTPFKGERSLKRPANEVTNMEIDSATKKPRVSIQGKEIVTLEDDEEESINQMKGFPIIEEPSHSKEASHPVSPSLPHSTSHSERTIYQIVIIEHGSKLAIDVQQYSFEIESSLYESKQDLVQKFLEERNLSTEENFKLMQDVKKNTYMGSSLLTVRERDNNTLRIALDDQVGGSEVRIQMNKIAFPEKIFFHKQISEVLYYDLLKSYLNKTKLESNVAKIEEQVRREKVASKGQKIQVKKLETGLVAQGSKDKESKTTKKLMDEKDKQIENLQKKLKMPITNHPQTDEIMSYQKKNGDLKKEVLGLNFKLLQE